MIPKAEHPRPDRARANWLNLNGEWDFALFPKNGEAAEAAFAKARTAYDQTIVVPFSWACPLSGVAKDTAGVGWYRRSAAFEAEGRIFLCFGAVDYLAEVYVNGQ
ncbi:MAG TPA: glycoside hydrolase family 2, partial [Clostridia bacterium]|nr:glycoside hydrolase family 2 [Clostridia bacterium]